MTTGRESWQTFNVSSDIEQLGWGLRCAIYESRRRFPLPHSYDNHMRVLRFFGRAFRVETTKDGVGWDYVIGTSLAL